MKVLHLLASGQTGGIEILCKDYAKFSKFDNKFLFIWDTGCITDEMKKENIDVIELHASKKNIIGTLIKILNICKRNKIEGIVVHHAAPIAHLYLMIIKKFYPHIKTIAYAHGNAVDMCHIKKKKGLIIRKLLITMSLKRADKIVAISQSVKKSLIEYFNILDNKITVIYNGVNTERFSPNFKLMNTTLNLIYVGRLIEEKGIQVTLQGLTNLPSDIDFKFRIIGEGPYRSMLESIVKEENLQDKVEFLGNRRDVPELLRKSDIFIHMPIWEEGFGITIIEAMASGLICICARSGAIPEIIQNGVDGFLVEKENYNELSNLILHSINLNEEDKLKIRKAAIQKSKKYSIINYAKKIDELIKNQ